MTTDAYAAGTQTRRLQLLLLLLILWDALALVAELSFGGPLFETSGDDIGGVLAGRGSFGGAAAVLLLAYVYALARGPLRHRGVLWLGVLEQAATGLFSAFHVAVGDMDVEAAIVPIVVSGALFVLLLLNMPRQTVS